MCTTTLHAHTLSHDQIPRFAMLNYVHISFVHWLERSMTRNTLFWTVINAEKSMYVKQAYVVYSLFVLNMCESDACTV